MALLIAGTADQLCFIGFDGGVDLDKLRARRDSLRLAGRRAASTVKSYESDWTCFSHWCSANGRISLPATDETVSLYTTWLLSEENKKTSTAQRRLVSIAYVHRRSSLTPPSMDYSSGLIADVRHQRKEQPQRKAALSVSDLVGICRGYDESTVRGCRDRAIIVLGFATSLRRSELGRLRLSDIGFRPEGLVVVVRQSKRDQTGRGRTIGVWAGKRAATDPVRVLRAWIEKRGIWDGPLFCLIKPGDLLTRTQMRGQAISEIVKAAAVRAGLDSSHYAGHSLRAGAITASADLGASDQELMKLSGHASAAMIKVYNRSTGLFLGRNPLAGVL